MFFPMFSSWKTFFLSSFIYLSFSNHLKFQIFRLLKSIKIGRRWESLCCNSFSPFFIQIVLLLLKHITNQTLYLSIYYYYGKCFITIKSKLVAKTYNQRQILDRSLILLKCHHLKKLQEILFI